MNGRNNIEDKSESDLFALLSYAKERKEYYKAPGHMNPDSDGYWYGLRKPYLDMIIKIEHELDRRVLLLNQQQQ